MVDADLCLGFWEGFFQASVRGACASGPFQGKDPQACSCLGDLFQDERKASVCASFSETSAAQAFEEFSIHFGVESENIPACLSALVGDLTHSTNGIAACDLSCVGAIANLYIPGMSPMLNRTMRQGQNFVTSIVEAAKWRNTNISPGSIGEEAECRAEMNGWAQSSCVDGIWMAYTCVCTNGLNPAPLPAGYIRRCACIPDPSGWWNVLKVSCTAYVAFIFGSACYMYYHRTGCVGRQRSGMVHG